MTFGERFMVATGITFIVACVMGMFYGIATAIQMIVRGEMSAQTGVLIFLGVVFAVSFCIARP